MGCSLESDHRPEEWLAATVARAGEPGVGPARTVDGRLFADVVAADLHGWVGDLGPDTGVLVKLLDAGQRLPVHVHPDRDFASSHLGCGYGKTEAWYVLAADEGATVHLGWTEDVDPEELAERRDRQDSAWMLERLHQVPVRGGDGILVPAGQPHAIGAGVFVVEAQEPTDFSIVLEWSVTTASREESHLDLGFDTAMGALSHRALAPGGARRAAPAPARRRAVRRADALPARAGRSLLPPRRARAALGLRVAGRGRVRRRGGAGGRR